MNLPVDGIPIIGHVKSLIYWKQKKKEQFFKAFNSSTHNTAVACLGVLGGYHIGFPGSVVGSIIGGVFIDAAISKFTPKYYGYFRSFPKWKSHGRTIIELFDLLYLAVKDTFTGLLAVYVFNKFEVAIESLSSIENQNETDLNSLMEKKENGFWPCFDSNEITVIPKIVLRGIPIQTLKHVYRSDDETASSQRLIRIIGLKCFGILGGHLTASLVSTDEVFKGSLIGGLLGGLFLDAAISIWNTMRQSGSEQTCVGYMRYIGWNMNSDSVVEILIILLHDLRNAYLAFKPWDICAEAMMARYFNKENKFDVHRIRIEEETGRDMSGIIYKLEIQKDMSGIICMYEQTVQKGYVTEINECRLDTCEKPDIKEDGDSSYPRRIWQTRIWNLPVAKTLPVTDISQLEPGDHLVYKGKIYNHHAIVAEVFPQKGRYIVYEQASSSNTNESKTMGKARIKENERSFDAESLYRVDYGEAGFKKDAVRKNAHFICHHAPDSYFKIKPYNFFLNNCEHFSNFCTIGRRVSYQSQVCWMNILSLQIGIIIGMCVFGVKFSELKYVLHFYYMNNDIDIN